MPSIHGCQVILYGYRACYSTRKYIVFEEALETGDVP